MGGVRGGTSKIGSTPSCPPLLPDYFHPHNLSMTPPH